MMMMGAAITLANYARAFLRAEEVRVHPAEHPAFQPFRSIRFSSGYDGEEIAKNPVDWFALMAQQKMSDAWLYVEPYDGRFRVIESLGFVGGQRWAPVTLGKDGEVIWYLRLQSDPGDPPGWDLLVAGHRRVQGPDSVVARPEEARRELREALLNMRAFEQRHLPEDGLGQFLTAASDVLDRTGPFPERIVALFAEKQPDPAKMQLAHALELGWVFGGMCSWCDRAFQGSLQNEFVATTETYYRAMLSALAAVGSR